MTTEIAYTLDRVLHPRGVAVVIQASHECISSRGIGMHGVAMATRRLTGQFERDPWRRDILAALAARSEEHTSELQSLMRISYAVFCLKKKKIINSQPTRQNRPPQLPKK